MERERNQRAYSTSATKNSPEVERFTIEGGKFQRLTIQSGDRYFYLYCTKENLDCRHDEIVRWADRLAQQLGWRTYETIINAVSAVEATERKYALFEYRFPSVEKTGHER